MDESNNSPSKLATLSDYEKVSKLTCPLQVVASLPAARLAGAMTVGRGDLQDLMLVERLEWLRGWLETTTLSDPDQQVPRLLYFATVWKCKSRCDALQEI